MTEWVYCLMCTVPQAYREAMECFLWEKVSWGWEESGEDSGTVVVYCSGYDQANSLAERLRRSVPEVEVSLHRKKNKQWQHVWRDFFQPVSVAETFLVLPSWQAPPDPYKGLIPLFIYPEMAFGTGHHPTTRLCLEAIAGVRAAGGLLPHHRCLDLGTGSGILGIACARADAWTLGVDNDRIAIHNASKNRKLNQVSQRFALAVGELDCLSRRSAFHLVVANILAHPLRDMADSLVRMVAPGGYLFLSGLLHSQEEDVSRAYRGCGLEETQILRQEEWSVLCWRKG